MTYQEIQTALEKSIAENPVPLPGDISRAVFTIHGQPIYAPLAANFLGVLDDDSKQAANKIFPSEIYPEFNPEINSPSKPASVIRAGKYAIWTPKTLAYILTSHGWTAPDDILAQLRELQNKYDALNGEYQKYSGIQAEHDWKSQRGNEVQKRANNQPINAPNRSLDEFKFDYRTKRQAIDDSIQSLTKQAAELAVSVIKSALNYVRLSLIVLEEQERAQADDFGIQFVPSYLLRCHFSILVKMTGTTTFEKLCQSACARNMLAGIVEL